MAATSDYVQDIEKWRGDLESRLKAADGWLTIAGLWWLEKGDATFGSDPAARITLPEGPKQAGFLRFDGQRVQVIPMPQVPLLVNNQPILNAALLNSDADGPPDIVTIGDTSMWVIKRGERIGIRMRDKNSKLRREFTHRNWFPIQEQYRMEGRYTAYAKPIHRQVPTVLDGVVEDQDAIGTVDFTLNGTPLKLEALKSGTQLWFVFRDKTSGKQTYGAARFLYAAAPKDGKTVLDFNKAYNPPCAFNPFTTCPLPVKQNIMPIAVEAGELKYDH